MTTLIDRTYYRDDDGRAVSVIMMTLLCHGCRVQAPRDCMQAGDDEYSQIALGHAARNHGWTAPIENGVVRDYCTTCSAARATQSNGEEKT